MTIKHRDGWRSNTVCIDNSVGNEKKPAQKFLEEECYQDISLLGRELPHVITDVSRHPNKIKLRIQIRFRVFCTLKSNFDKYSI